VVAKLSREKTLKLGGCGIPYAPPKPLDAKKIDALAFPGGKPLPPSLKRWLAFDARYLGIFKSLARPKLERVSFLDMMKHEFDARTAETYDFSFVLPGDCYVVPGGSDSRRFLYVGDVDDAGEYPILLVDTDDTPFVCVEYPGLDVYLAMEFGVVKAHGADEYAGLFEDPAWKSAMEAQARKNLCGFKSIDMGGGSTQHVDGADAAAAAEDELYSALE
jgi:hypothetical protein